MDRVSGKPASHDQWTVLAVGILVYVLAKLIHEGVGHGIVCEAAGGELLAFSSSWCDCDRAGMSAWGNRAVKAGGTMANLFAGGVFWLMLARMTSATGYYFAWLSAGVNTLMGGGYLMVDPLFRFGDWSAFLEGLEPQTGLRLALTAGGVAISLATFFALRLKLPPLLGRDEGRVRRAALLCLLPYAAAGGALLTGAALLNPFGPKLAFTSALATLGGTFLLVWLPTSLRGLPAADLRPIRRSPAWLAGGAATTLFLLLAFGRGIYL